MNPWLLLASSFLGVLGGAGFMLFVSKRLLAAQPLPPAAAPAPTGPSPEMELALKNLATEVMSANSKSFLELARTQLHQESALQQRQVETLVKPLADQVAGYKKELAELESARNKEYGGLDRLLKSVVESNQQLKSETSNLVNALKRPTVRGRWGEIQLRRVVEMAGLSKHCDFSEQVSVDSDEGRLRPDLIVNLPNGRQIVIDSKAVLNGYLEAEEATDDLTRKAALIRHASAVKTRITELSRKNYWDQFKQAPEFVVLFIPGEAFFSAALEVMPDLVETGFDQKVVLATPTTLMALLKAVAFGWRQEQLAENSRRIADQANRIYQGLAVWTQHLATLGTSLDRATKAYNSAVGSLEKSVLPPTRKMREYGVTAKDELAELPTIDTALRKPQETLASENPAVSDETSAKIVGHQAPLFDLD